MTKDIENKKTTIDPLEHEKFSKLAEEWWDPNGKFKTLHKFNPVRLEFIISQIKKHFNISNIEQTPLSGLKILDIGCGGGLMCEPLARLYPFLPTLYGPLAAGKPMPRAIPKNIGSI